MVLPSWERTCATMRIIAVSTLEGCWVSHPKARTSLETWLTIARVAKWQSMNDIVKSGFCSPSPVGDSRVVFNIAGNSFRLICGVVFARPDSQGILYVKWFGTHSEYDKIDALTAEMDFG